MLNIAELALSTLTMVHFCGSEHYLNSQTTIRFFCICDFGLNVADYCICNTLFTTIYYNATSKTDIQYCMHHDTRSTRGTLVATLLFF